MGPKGFFASLAIPLGAVLGSNALAQGQASNPLLAPFNFLLKGVEDVISDVKSPQGRALRAYVNEREWVKADKFYASERDYFNGTSDYKALLQQIADELSKPELPRLAESLEVLKALDTASAANRNEWAHIKETLGTAKSALRPFGPDGEYAVLRESAFRAGLVGEVESTLLQAQSAIAQEAPKAFASYDHFQVDRFFDAYPVELDAGNFLAENYAVIEQAAKGRSGPELRALLLRYPKLPKVALNAIRDDYAKRLIPSNGGIDFASATGVLIELSKLGMDGSSLPGVSMAILDASDGSMPFKFSLKDDLPIPLFSGQLSHLGSSDELRTRDYVVLFSPVTKEPRRRVSDRKDVQSRFQTGTRPVANPDYEKARINYLNALNEYNQRSTRAPASPAEALLRGIADGLAAGTKNRYYNELQSMSPTLDEAIYSDYSFKVSEIETIKQAELRLTVVDIKNGRAARFTVPWEEKRKFQVAYGIQDKDPDRYSYRQQYSTEEGLDSYEKQGEVYQAGELLEKFLANKPEWVAYSSPQDLFPSSQIASAIPKATSQSQDQVDDPAVKAEMDSVVVVINPKGILGSGFYVAPNLVLTNYHVVEGAKFAQLKLRNGTETVGRVLRWDAGLDLALLKVADDGAPVTFYSAPLSAGSAVEAVGHPRGLTFSLTRGVISAIRKMKNPLVPGSREMLVIQTDTAINPGNSGGPLYFRGQVIGINTQKFSAKGLEGLGFAVHYAEIAGFLQEQ